MGTKEASPDAAAAAHWPAPSLHPSFKGGHAAG